MKNRFALTLATAACLFLLIGREASATVQDAIVAATPHDVTSTLSGTTQTDVWTPSGLSAASNPGYPGYPGTGAWPSPIGSTTGGDATLNKTGNGAGGGPYPFSSADGGLYAGGMSSTPNTVGGTLEISDTTPVAGLSTVVFQLEMSGAFGYNLFSNGTPTFSYSLVGSDDMITLSLPPLAATFEHADSGTMSMGEELYVDLLAWQWDLTGIEGDIDAFSISFTVVQHSRVYSARIDQSDQMTEVVPEPSTYALMLMGAGILFWSYRRRVA